jgi:Protein of unknown function (DUF3551)
MRSLALTILTIGVVSAAGQAQAQTYDPAYPVCLYVVSFGATPYYRCSYTTMDQCRASANGQMCSLNPFYAGATAPVRRNNRRYYRQIGSRSPALAETRACTYKIGGGRLTSAMPLIAARKRTSRDFRVGPKNEPAYAGARCARGGVRGSDGGSS